MKKSYVVLALGVVGALGAGWMICAPRKGPASPPVRVVSSGPPSSHAEIADAAFSAADGKQVRLSDYRGKQAVVLLFGRGFTGEFCCTYCARQTKDYRGSYEKLKAAGAEVLMVLPGAKAEGIPDYLEKVGLEDDENPEPDFKVPYPVVTDLDCKGAAGFGVPIDPPGSGPFPVSKPATVVVGKDGSIVYAYHGANPSDRPSAETVLGVLQGKKPQETRSAAAPAAANLPTLAWVPYEAGMEAARTRKKPILLEFYADW